MRDSMLSPYKDICVLSFLSGCGSVSLEKEFSDQCLKCFRDLALNLLKLKTIAVVLNRKRCVSHSPGMYA